MNLETAQPELLTYVERATIIWSHRNTIKGHEARVVTGYAEIRDVPDAPDGSGKMEVFVPVREDVCETSVAQLEELLGKSNGALARDAASKGARAAQRKARIAELEAALAESIALAERRDAACRNLVETTRQNREALVLIAGGMGSGAKDKKAREAMAAVINAMMV